MGKSKSLMEKEQLAAADGSLGLCCISPRCPFPVQKQENKVFWEGQCSTMALTWAGREPAVPTKGAGDS